MNDPTLDLIRSVNPYPVPLPGLPIEPVLQRVRAIPVSRRSRLLRRPDAGLLAGAVALAASVAVIAAVAIVTLTGAQGTTSALGGRRPTPTSSRPVPFPDTEPIHLRRAVATTAFRAVSGRGLLVGRGTHVTLTVALTHLPTLHGSSGYALWIFGTHHRREFLGYFATQPRHGRLDGEVKIGSRLETGIPGRLAVTIQIMGAGDPRPGRVILAGAIPAVP